MKKIITLLLIALSSFAKAQTACDSLNLKVHYYPFNDSVIQVDVFDTNTTTFFSYPIFTIFDSNGDTVALEALNFFGIGGESHHELKVFPGMTPTDTFTGTLTLYYQTIDSYAVCTWPMFFDLCPDTCYTVQPYMVNMGSAQVIGDALWSILDDNNQTVATGTFTLDAGNQYDYDSVCLDPGNYSLKVFSGSLSPGGNKHVGLESELYNAGYPDTAFNGVDSTLLGFQFFESCAAPVSVKETKAKAALHTVYSFANTIYINTPGEVIGEISVYSIDGKKVFTTRTANTSYNLSLPATGIYIVRVMNKTGTTVRKVYIEQ